MKTIHKLPARFGITVAVLLFRLFIAQTSIGLAMPETTTLLQLAAVTDAEIRGFSSADVGFERVVIDSRSVSAGDVFWALPGSRYDGHDFVTDAFARGARFCVVQENRTTFADYSLAIVRETQRALTEFAAWHRQRTQVPVVAVTGSVGKTTTREMIVAALSSRLDGTRSPKNYNNHTGVPLSLLGIEKRHQFAVVELGASRAGEIRELAAMAAPQIGVLTGIGPAHLTGFGDERQIAAAKGELIDALPASGLAVLAGDDSLVRPLAGRARCRVHFVGEGPDNDTRAERVAVHAARLQVRVGGTDFEIPATGRHHVTAVLTAITVAREFGLSFKEIAAGLRSFQPVAGRCRLEQCDNFTVIDDTYNANPSSMRAACELLRDLPSTGKKILVVGDMLELGSRAIEFHRRLGRDAAGCGIEVLLAYGRHAQDVLAGARDAETIRVQGAFLELEPLLESLRSDLSAGDVILIKGSRAMQMQRVVDRLRGWSQEALREHTSRPVWRAYSYS